LNENDYLKPRLFTNNQLSNLRMEEQLPVEGNLIKTTEARSDGYYIEGHTKLTSTLIPRPADAILVVVQSAGFRDILALAHPSSPETPFTWEADLPKELVEPYINSTLELWAMDIRTMSAHQMPKRVLLMPDGIGVE